MARNRNIPTFRAPTNEELAAYAVLHERAKAQWTLAAEAKRVAAKPLLSRTATDAQQDAYEAAEAALTEWSSYSNMVGMQLQAAKQTGECRIYAEIEALAPKAVAS